MKWESRVLALVAFVSLAVAVGGFVSEVTPGKFERGLALWTEYTGLQSAADWVADNTIYITALATFALGFVAGMYFRKINAQISTRKDDPAAFKPQLVQFAENVRTTRDAHLYDALCYIVTGEWGKKLEWLENPDQANALANACTDVMQNALDGKLPIWGRIGLSGLQEEIPREYWKHYQINFMKVMGLQKPEELTVEPKRAATIRWRRYEGLMTSKYRVEELWSAKSSDEAISDSATDSPLGRRPATKDSNATH